MLKSKFGVSGIYMIRNNVDCKSYIGSARSIKARWSDHKEEFRTRSHKNKQLQKDWIELGEECFELILLEQTEDDDLLMSERELYYIDLYDTYENGYNMTRNTYRNKLNGEAKSVIQYTIDGRFMKVFNSIQQASNDTGVDNTSISGVCNGGHRSAGGFVWRFKVDDDFPEIIIVPRKHNITETSVVQYSRTGVFIEVFETIKEASKKTGVSGPKIGGCCSGTIKFGGDYVWKYKEEIVPEKITVVNRYYQIPIVQFSVDGNYIKEWSCAPEAANTLGFISACIKKSCKKKVKTAYGFIWRYKDEVGESKKINIPSEYLKRKLLKKPVLQYSLSGQFLKQFDGVVDAERLLNIGGPSIIFVCKNKGYYAGDFYWRYKESEKIENKIEVPSKTYKRHISLSKKKTT